MFLYSCSFFINVNEINVSLFLRLDANFRDFKSRNEFDDGIIAGSGFPNTNRVNKIYCLFQYHDIRKLIIIYKTDTIHKNYNNENGHYKGYN